MEENGEVQGGKAHETNPKLTRTNRHGRLHRTRSERTRQAQEMIAVFGKQRFETKKTSRKRRRMVNGEPSRVEEHVVITPEEEDYVYTQLSSLRESLPMRHRAYVQEQLLGGGANGIAYVRESGDSCTGDAMPISCAALHSSLLDKQWMLTRSRVTIDMQVRGKSQDQHGNRGSCVCCLSRRAARKTR